MKKLLLLLWTSAFAFGAAMGKDEAAVWALEENYWQLRNLTIPITFLI